MAQNGEYRAIEPLESRRLLSGAPAELLATLPPAYGNVNLNVDDALVVNDKLFFTVDRQFDPERLYVSEGGGSATLLVTSRMYQGVSALTSYHGKLYFFASGPDGDALYASDGTPEGTGIIKIIRNNANVLPEQSFILNNRLYFFWANLGQPVRLWSSDGTAAGTNPIWDLPQGYVQSISPVIDGHVFFGAYGQLWRTDGTAAGTISMWTGPETYIYPGMFTVTDDKLFFVELAYGRRPLYAANLDGSSVRHIEIPSDDGFETGVWDSTLLSLGHRILFISATNSSHMERLYSTDGTSAGLVQLAGGTDGYYFRELSRLALAGDRAVFLQSSSSPQSRGLWSTDGTLAGTQQILSMPIDVLGTSLFSSGGKAFFPALAGQVGMRLIETNGTAAGTRPIRYLATGTSLTNWQVLRVATYQDRIVLRGYNRDGILELWSLNPDVPTGSITGKLYNDINRNGTREGFERYYSGTAYLDLDGNDSMDPFIDAISQADLGDPYLFDGLPPDHYTVRLAGNQKMTNPLGDEYQIDLQPGQNVTAADFAVGNTSSVVWGAVFEDTNHNGVRDAGERGVGGQVVFVDLNGDGNPHYIDEPVMETAADGTYGFALSAGGTYKVSRAGQAGWLPPGTQARTVDVAEGQVLEVAPFAIVADSIPPRVESGEYDFTDNRIRLVFSEDIGETARYGAVRLRSRKTNALIDTLFPLSYDPASHVAVFGLPSGLANGNYLLEISPTYYINDLAGNRMTENFSLDFFILKGDLNRDRQVSVDDFMTLSSNFGKTNATYAEGDINYDGSVTIADFIDLAANFNASLAPPSATTIPQAAAAESILAPIQKDNLLQVDPATTRQTRDNVAFHLQTRRRPHHRRRHLAHY